MQKKRIIFILKLLLSLIIFYLILRDINIHLLVENFNKLSIGVILLLIIATILKKILQMWNWQRFLIIDPEYKPTRQRVISTFFIGEALRFLLPGGYGIVGKIYFIDNSKRNSFLSIGLEKFFQIWTSLALACIAGFFYFENIALWIRISLNIVVLLLPFFLVLIRHFVKHESIQSYTKQYIRYAPTIIIRSFIMMFITAIQYYLIIGFFGNVGFSSILLVVPLILSANLLPITYGGLGLRESFAISILDKYGIVPEAAITCSLTIFVLSSILPALIGLVYIIKSRNR